MWMMNPMLSESYSWAVENARLNQRQDAFSCRNVERPSLLYAGVAQLIQHKTAPEKLSSVPPLYLALRRDWRASLTNAKPDTANKRPIVFAKNLGTYTSMKWLINSETKEDKERR
jgi:hypothetical protein